MSSRCLFSYGLSTDYLMRGSYSWFRIEWLNLFSHSFRPSLLCRTILIAVAAVSLYVFQHEIPLHACYTVTVFDEQVRSFNMY